MTKYVLFITNKKIPLQLLKYTNLIRLKVLLALFTSIPDKETIKCILYKIYVDKSIKPLFYFQNIISEINKRMCFFCEFQFNKANWWISNGWSCSCCFFRHFLCKDDVVVPTKPIFYKRYVKTNTYTERKMLMMNYSRIWIATIQTLNQL